MTTAQEILSQQDVFLAIQQKKAAKQAEVNKLKRELAKCIDHAIAPQPRATNKVDFAIQVARNVYNIWQGISLGLKVVNGFKYAFSKKR